MKNYMKEWMYYMECLYCIILKIYYTKELNILHLENGEIKFGYMYIYIYIL